MIAPWRRFAQVSSLLLLVLIPVLNYMGFHFIQGGYQSLGLGAFWIVSPLEALESILASRSFYLPLLIAMILPILITVFLGRVFCSWICPVNTLQALSDHIFRGSSRVHRERFAIPLRVIWIVLALDLLIAFLFRIPLFAAYSPPGIFGREIARAVFFHTLALEAIILLAILIMNLFTRRWFCRALCPLGGLLAAMGAKRLLRVSRPQGEGLGCGVCDQSCPLGLSPSRGEADSSHCWNCGRCVDVCADSGLKLGFGKSVKPARSVPRVSGSRPGSCPGS